MDEFVAIGSLSIKTVSSMAKAIRITSRAEFILLSALKIFLYVPIIGYRGCNG
jgi:hypothetical protein